MKLTEKDIRPNTLWVHSKGGIYLILGFVRSSTNGREHEPREVLYYSFKYETYNRREVGEFLDGRFQPFPVEGNSVTLPKEDWIGGRIPDTREGKT